MNSIRGVEPSRSHAHVVGSAARDHSDSIIEYQARLSLAVAEVPAILGDLDDLRQASKGGMDPNGFGTTIVAGDVLWSDPVSDPGFAFNDSRGVGMVFGECLWFNAGAGWSLVPIRMIQAASAGFYGTPCAQLVVELPCMSVGCNNKHSGIELCDSILDFKLNVTFVMATHDAGPDVTECFLAHNNLRLILRSHEGPDARFRRTDMPSVAEGYALDHSTRSECVLYGRCRLILYLVCLQRTDQPSVARGYSLDQPQKCMFALALVCCTLCLCNNISIETFQSSSILSAAWPCQSWQLLR